MPYIRKDTRDDIDMGYAAPQSVGDLNYVLTRRCLDHLSYPPTYADFNEVIGVLECVKLEMYRRMVAPYEDRKCEENGDVYPTE